MMTYEIQEKSILPGNNNALDDASMQDGEVAWI